MDEFGFIAKYLSGLAGDEGLGLKDDAAVWSPPLGNDAVISMDTLVEGVHFPDGTFDKQLAHKLLAVNISDLTAKGARPLGYFMSLALRTDISQGELHDFCQGLAITQSLYGLKLWGGDTTRGGEKTVLTITIVGHVPIGQTVTRSGAKIGDLLCVTGCLGDSYLGLQSVLGWGGANMAAQQDINHWKQIYHKPNPPFALYEAIRQCAHAGIDVSDGLLADAGHMALASGVQIDIILDEIPVSLSSQKWMHNQSNKEQALLRLASGGDDYQVLMSVSQSKYKALRKQAQSAGIRLSVIGRVYAGAGVTCVNSKGQSVSVSKQGYTHF